MIVAGAPYAAAGKMHPRIANIRRTIGTRPENQRHHKLKLMLERDAHECLNAVYQEAQIRNRGTCALSTRTLRQQRNSLKKKALIVFAIVAFAASSPCFSMDPRTYASLRRLDPDVRLEQVCDLAAMERIRKEKREFHPDRAKSDITTHPLHLGDTLRAAGGAFRSKGNWYELSFVCTAASDHLRVVSLNYMIGKLIPESRWDDYGLWR